MRVMVVDLDDTLVDDLDATREAIAWTLKRANLPAGKEAVDTALRRARKLWAAHPHRHTGPLAHVSAWEALWLPTENTNLPAPVTESLATHEHRVWAAIIASLGGDARDAPTAAMAFRRQRHNLVRLLPGARDALDMMSHRHRLWLATNGLPVHQRAKLTAAGLAPYFDRMLISGELGAAKSEPAFAAAVHAALEQDGTRVCLVIGDSSVHDLALAAHGRWPAVHLCRTSPCPAQIAPQTAVSHLSSLADVAAHCRCPGVD